MTAQHILTMDTITGPHLLAWWASLPQETALDLRTEDDALALACAMVKRRHPSDLSQIRKAVDWTNARGLQAHPDRIT